MARHNFLIQQCVGGDNNGNHRLILSDTWLDTTPFGGTHRDSFGNMGYETIEEARKEIKSYRKTCPGNAVRIIQIVS